MKTVYTIEEMRCEGCARTIQERLSRLPEIECITVDLKNKEVTIDGEVTIAQLQRSLVGTKYQVMESTTAPDKS